MNREQAIAEFTAAYLSAYNLPSKPAAIRFIIENKLIETHNAFYLRGLELKLSKGRQS